MKTCAKIFLSNTAILLSVGLHSQTLTTSEYFDLVSRNVSQSDNKVLKCNCIGISFDSRLNEFPGAIMIAGETYAISDDVKYAYNHLCELPDKDKCKILSQYYFLTKLISPLSNSGVISSDFACLPIALTGMNHLFAGADETAGIWKLQYFPALRYGLFADSCRDDRFDISLSTKAAVTYLNTLHELFGRWDLAILAYTSSPAYVNKIIDENSGFMHENDKAVFNVFIASILWCNSHLNQVQKIHYGFLPEVLDSVTVQKKIHTGQLEAVLHISTDSIKALNPHIICDVIYGDLKPVLLILPSFYAKLFVEKQDSIAIFRDSVFFPKPKIPDGNYATHKTPEYNSSDYEKIEYIIESGDNLGYIAEKFHVSINDIKDWNDISGTTIYAGKKIIIFKKKTVAKTNTPTAPKQNNTPKTPDMKNLVFQENYVVQKGDYLYEIAKKYPGVSAEDIMQWNNITNPEKIQIGQTLKIYKKK